jgi:uncharacterized protein YqgV (UPF0045/DUF77 family)
MAIQMKEIRMDVAVELSLYPLRNDFIPPIAAFIERLNTHPGLRVDTNSMSTQVTGEYRHVMQTLTTEIERTFASLPKAVVVMKVLGPMAP